MTDKKPELCCPLALTQEATDATAERELKRLIELLYPSGAYCPCTITELLIKMLVKSRYSLAFSTGQDSPKQWEGDRRAIMESVSMAYLSVAEEVELRWPGKVLH